MFRMTRPATSGRPARCARLTMAALGPALLSIMLAAPAQAQCGPDAGDCLEENGTPGCDGVACCEVVCAKDAFCCDTEWDGICVDAAESLCTTCGQVGAGDCLEANGTPACEDVTCCVQVCGKDPFCCDTEWDGICAEDAISLCNLPPQCGEADAGSCFEANGTTACDNTNCCETVCAFDPFCCETEWDSSCASSAIANCSCGGPDAGDCLEANGTPACEDLDCCEQVCIIDSFCCDATWDSACASTAEDVCFGTKCGDMNAGSCFEANGTPACNRLACCETVCQQDSFCCEIEWDGSCAEAANAVCPLCETDLNNDGQTNGADLGILLGAWGACPVDPCTSPESDCCSANGGPGCSCVECAECVCIVDKFCCDVEWDTACVQAATIDCGNSCPDCSLDSTTGFPCPADFTGDGQVNGADLGILLGGWGPCSIDPCTSPDSDCCTANGSPGCSCDACEECVCLIDPFCCETEWDGTCADEAAIDCENSCPCF